LIASKLAFWRPAVSFHLSCAAAAILAGCGGSELSGPRPDQVLTQASAKQNSTFKPGHLYVAQGIDIVSRVYRFPINGAGLPSTKPDGHLDLGFRYPSGIAVGPNGDLYVSSSGDANACKNERKCFVEVFAPGASGHAKPLRVLYVPQQPEYIAVDQHGYLDVSTLQGQRLTNVYQPNASGQDKPIDEIATAGVNALGASRGIVYFQVNSLGVGVEGVTELPGSGQPVYYSYGYNYSADGVVAYGKDLYAQYFYPRRGGFFLATAVFSIDPPSLLRTVVGTGCEVSRNGGALGYGLAVHKKYLYEGCLGLGGASGGVVVYDSTKSGKQAPILELTGGNVGVAIGP
jgi:hypothetical protein